MYFWMGIYSTSFNLIRIWGWSLKCDGCTWFGILEVGMGTQIHGIVLNVELESQISIVRGEVVWGGIKIEGQNHKAGKGKRRPKIKGWPKQKKAKMHLTSILHSFIWHFAFFPSREKTWAYLQEILPTITPYFWKTGSAMHIHQTSPHSTFLSSVQISEISEVMILFFFWWKCFINNTLVLSMILVKVSLMVILLEKGIWSGLEIKDNDWNSIN